MQESQHRPDYPTVDDPALASAMSPDWNAGTDVSTLEPYIPPNVPHGLPHVVRFATLSSMDLPLEVRFLIIMLARFASMDGVASVAVSTLCEICRIGSKNTVERWLGLAADIGILQKEPGKGGKDRKSNSYTFLGTSREWAPLPVGRPDTNPIVALAQARRLIENLQLRAARMDGLEAELVRLRAELALLRNGGADSHPQVTDGDGNTPYAPRRDSYETAGPDDGRESHGAIGHSEVTDGSPENPSEVASQSYETPDSGGSQETHEAIGHSEVTNGPLGNPSEEATHSYENIDSGSFQGAHDTIGHFEVTNGVDEGKEYLARRDRVETLVMKHRTYYERSFNRRGVLGAIEFFSRSVENEQDLIRQVGILDAGGDPRQAGSGPAPGDAAQPQTRGDPDRYAVGDCPDCRRPFATHGGAEYCTDCTERRRRESGA